MFLIYGAPIFPGIIGSKYLDRFGNSSAMIAVSFQFAQSDAPASDWNHWIPITHRGDMGHRKVVLVLLARAILALPMASQTPPTQKPSFEVASVKPNKLGGPPIRMGTEGGRFIAENYPLSLLIQFAYRSTSGTYLLRQNVIGGPTWLDTDRFDIEAKVSGDSRTIPTEQMLRMAQSLLEDRFQLKVHREKRELPVYKLLVAKGGLKMKPSADQTLPHRDDEDDQPNAPFDPSAPPARGETVITYTPSGEMVLAGTATPISPNPAIHRPHALPPRSFTTVLEGNVGRPVIDKTNLKGLFDFRLQFSREPLSGNPDGAGISIITALQEQLGLRLESAKGPVEVLMIDSVQKPSEN